MPRRNARATKKTTRLGVDNTATPHENPRMPPLSGFEMGFAKQIIEKR